MSPGAYLRRIADDYKDVAVETGQDMKARPFKSCVVLSSLGATVYLIRTNPSEESFHTQLVEHSLSLLQVGDPTRNPKGDGHIQHLSQCYNAGLLRRFSLGVCSVMWHDKFDREVDMFEARCKPLKVGWVEMWGRVLDVGVVGRWRGMDMAMMDYDINPTEWPQEEGQDGSLWLWQKYFTHLWNAKG